MTSTLMTMSSVRAQINTVAGSYESSSLRAFPFVRSMFPFVLSSPGGEDVVTSDCVCRLRYSEGDALNCFRKAFAKFSELENPRSKASPVISTPGLNNSRRAAVSSRTRRVNSATDSPISAMNSR